MPISSFKMISIAAIALLTASMAVFAQSAPPPVQPGTPDQVGRAGNPMAACRADMQALCGSVQASRGARLQCLVENRTKASPACQSAMAALQDRAAQRIGKKGEKAGRQGRFAACQTDIATFCADSAKGGGRAQCLRQNAAQLSPACNAALQQAKADRIRGSKQAKEACSSDAQALCGAAGTGRGAVMQCLRQNETKVSPACGQALAALPLRRKALQTPTSAPGTVPSSNGATPAQPQ